MVKVPGETPGRSRVFIVAGEDSGDLHASNLILRMRERDPELVFEGYGGPRMAAAGCELHANIVHLAAMGFSFLGNVKSFFALVRTFHRRLRDDPPDALVLVDYPGFNFILARLARRRRVPVVYYICPQIWAWAPWRRRKILKLTDLLLVILPFEEEYYREPGHEVIYVGHPLADALAEQPPAEDLARRFRREFDVPEGQRLVAFFPGSRSHEVALLLPLFRRTVERMCEERSLDPERHRLAVSCCREEFEPRIREAFADLPIPVDVVRGDSHPLMAACEFAFVASGTATLELAFYEKPMVVLYRVSWLGYRIFRIVCISPFISLVNILGGEAVVPEEISCRDRPEVQAERARLLLNETPERARCLEKLRALKASAFFTGASDRAADALAGFLRRVNPAVVRGEGTHAL